MLTLAEVLLDWRIASRGSDNLIVVVLQQSELKEWPEKGDGCDVKPVEAGQLPSEVNPMGVIGALQFLDSVQSRGRDIG
jgi:hypothetical protein